jgi:pimeloyl-ACP methyl ester carboxylesterase
MSIGESAVNEGGCDDQESQVMPSVKLNAGSIEYEDNGAAAPVVVLLHGVLMDSGLWREVARDLGGELRVIIPTLPLGAHRTPMRPDADLSLRGHARIVAAFLAALDLRDVTLVFNDWAAPQLLIADGLDDGIGGLVLVACETAGNYPPGLPGKNLVLLTKVPGGVALALRGMRFKPMRRLPFTFGWMAKHGMPDDLVDRWLDAALNDRGVVADALKYFRGTKAAKQDLIAATQQLHRFERPVTVVWSREDKVMPAREGEALAAAFPNARLEWVDDAYALIPLDQPGRMAELIREHISRQHATPAST